MRRENWNLALRRRVGEPRTASIVLLAEGNEVEDIDSICTFSTRAAAKRAATRPEVYSQHALIHVAARQAQDQPGTSVTSSEFWEFVALKFARGKQLV
jgi:hypothetical protein